MHGRRYRNYSNIHDFAGELAPGPDSRAIEDQYPRHHCQERANAAQETARWAVPKLVVHLCRYEREYSS